MSVLNNRYQILRTLGRGGFGETFLAEDTHMPSHRYCVIKQLKPLTNNAEVYQLVQERFQREAAILEDVGEGNPQIPKLYAYFSEENQFYLVQEWVDGVTLSQKLRQEGRVRENEVQQILAHLLPVLDYIHSKGIVHRDIKPDNIIVRSLDGLPVLIDFGAVRETMGTLINTQGNTTSSIVIGTPGFMPSEQAAGRPVFSSDLYSLGLTAIYLLTGKTPQELGTDSQTGEILWRHNVANLSPQFVEVLDKAIRSHPRERFPTAKAMLDALYTHPTVAVAPSVPATTPSVEPAVMSAKNIPSTLTVPSSPTKASSNNSVIISSAIAGTLVGTSVIVGLFLTRSPQPISNNNNQVQPTILSSPSPTPISRPSSEQSIRDYYNKINAQDYSSGWNQLSYQSRNDASLHPKGYQSYTDWWTQVDRVDILGTYLVEEDLQNAIVDTDLRYILENGKIINQTLSFDLIWDDETNSWLINKVRRLSQS